MPTSVSNIERNIAPATNINPLSEGSYMEALRSVGLTEVELAQIGSKPSRCCILRVKTNDMAPYVYPGESVVIDISRRRIEDAPRGIYCVQIDGRNCLRQAYVASNGRRVLNTFAPHDKKVFILPTEPDRLHVFGQVVHRVGSGNLPLRRAEPGAVNPQAVPSVPARMETFEAFVNAVLDER